MKLRNCKFGLTFLVFGWISSGCATMDRSLELGGGLGAAAGIGAVYSGSAISGKAPSLEAVAIGAGIGSVIGLITSYFTHKSVVEDRKSNEADQIEMHFGDLPPSPFIVPKPQIKKGAK